MCWQEKFFELYTSGSLNNHSKALELKLKNIPTKLYRYRPLSDNDMKYRFNEIVNGELYMSHPNELNDPFEATTCLLSLSPADYIHNKEQYKEGFKGKIPFDTLNAIFSEDNWFEAMITYVSEISLPNGKNEELKEDLYKSIMIEMEKLSAYFSGASRDNTRIAAFSKTPNNLPMWHHYTNGHQGVCLEYETNSIPDIYQKNRLFPVKYVEKLPDVVNEMLRKKVPTCSVFQYMSMHKLSDWSYEKEWRLIYDAGSWYFRQEDVPTDFYTKGKVVSFIRPSKIITGINIREHHKREINKMAESVNIPVVEAKQTEYGLIIE